MKGLRKIAKALRADRVVSLEMLPSQGPLDLLELRAEVQRRQRQEAMEAYGRGCQEDLFEAIAGEDFEDR